MQYMGGKAAVAKELCVFLESIREGRPYLEPFCGSMNVISRMIGDRTGSDAGQAIISFYEAVREGWAPTQTISHEEWLMVKAENNPLDPRNALCAWGLSYRGAMWATYTPHTAGVPKQACAMKSAHHKVSRMDGVKLSCRGYQSYTPENTVGMLIYCDPPYATTDALDGTRFDSESFWLWAEEMSRTNLVLVSEYTAPSLIGSRSGRRDATLG